MIEGGLLQDATQMKLDVLSAMHFTAEALKVITPTTIKNCSVKCGFSIDHISSNDGSAVKLSDDEKDDWCSLQPLGLQFEDYTICDTTLKVCDVQNIDQVLDQQLTRPEKGPEKEVAEDKNFLGCTERIGSRQKVLG
jgi:hypothetical protein